MLLFFLITVFLNMFCFAKGKKKQKTFILTKHTPTITMLTICQLNPYTRIDWVYLKPQVTVSIRIFF